MFQWELVQLQIFLLHLQFYWEVKELISQTMEAEVNLLNLEV